MLISSALLLDSLHPSASAFCAERSACQAVRAHAPSPFGVTHFLPMLGVIAYVGLFWLSFAERWRVALRWSAASGGVIGALLLGYQGFIIGTWCGACVSIDVLAICLGVLAWRAEASHEPFRGWGWAGLFAIAINAPVAWQHLGPRRAPLPWLEPTPGALELVHFVDFQCRHCRELHPTLEQALESVQVPLRHRWYHFPLPIHPLAEAAARAAICAERLGAGDAMAQRLLEQPLLADVWMRHASELGLEKAAFETCLHAQATRATLSRHKQLYRQTGAQGLPVTFINGEMIQGAVPRAQIEDALARARSQLRFPLPGWLFAVLTVAAATLWMWGARSREPARPPSSDSPPRPAR